MPHQPDHSYIDFYATLYLWFPTWQCPLTKILHVKASGFKFFCSICQTIFSATLIRPRRRNPLTIMLYITKSLSTPYFSMSFANSEPSSTEPATLNLLQHNQQHIIHEWEYCHNYYHGVACTWTSNKNKTLEISSDPTVPEYENL